MPEPQNDFIFAIFAEEMGFVGVIIIISLFIFLIGRGLQISAKAPDLFRKTYSNRSIFINRSTSTSEI
ncbi:MAG: FtsW/RodA/SpoVE family cell cycle protein [Clostridiales bacterium]|nr:FtsW/RodA/SpoVE family cell cycle protein [Clostridiales bacterium]